MLRRLVLFGSLLAGIALGQEADRTKPPETTFRATSDFVQLNVSVFDKEGKLVKDLPRSAFTVFEDNVRQEIKVFRQEDVPISMGLIIDSSASMKDKWERVASAAVAMVKASNPEDEIFIMNFNEEATLAQEFTRDIAVLAKSLRTVNSQGMTAMRDAVLVGIAHLRNRGKREKKVLVVVTDGDDNSSVGTQPHLIEVAHRQNVLIYGIGILGGEPPQATARMRKQLEELTLPTGGGAWFPDTLDEMARITPEIAHEIRNQYIVGYKPGNPSAEGAFHRIRVEVAVPGAMVRTRSGYYARR